MSRVLQLWVLLPLLCAARRFPKLRGPVYVPDKAPYPKIADPSLPKGHNVCGNVSLFSIKFETFQIHHFNVSFPAACLREPGNTRVILSLSCNVTAGRQFDRSTYVTLGGAVVFAGTTSEPGQHAAPAWVAQTDLTEYFNLLRMVTMGTVQLGTAFSPKYNGIPSCSGYIVLYSGVTTPPPPDIVIPLGTATSGAALNKTIAGLPNTAASAYLKVLAQGQQADEFWWSCVPNNFSKALDECGNSAYRHLLVTIDGVAVSLLPVQPFIFTGGVDPLLWIPTPAPQTLHLLPHHLPLEPGFFQQGASNHSVLLHVGPAANSFWYISATLFVHVDASVVGRGIDSHTPPDVSSHVTSSLNTSTLNGTVTVSASSTSQTIGYVDRSGPNTPVVGRSLRKTHTSFSFSNAQTFVTRTAPKHTQLVVAQQTSDFQLTVSDGDTQAFTRLQAPLFSSIFTTVVNANASVMQSVFRLGYESQRMLGKFTSNIANHVNSTDTLLLNTTGGGFGITGNTNQSSAQSYSYRDTAGNCYQAAVEGMNNTFGHKSVACNSLADWVDPFYGWAPASTDV